ncbi:MAG: murein hydrolase activator EnvC family protein [Egibacteraceae bacterium]
MTAVRRAPLLAVVLAAVLLVVPVGSAGAQEVGLEQARTEREQLSTKITNITQEFDQLTAAIAETQTKRDRLEGEVGALQAAAAAARGVLTRQAVRAYTHGGFGPLGELFTAVAPGEAIERARMLAGLSLREREVAEQAVIARDALAVRRADLDGTLAELRDYEARAAALRAQLEAAFARAKATEAELASRQTRQRQVSRAGQRGLYACPMGGPYAFTDTWGAPRSGGRWHKGVDLFAPYGGNVYAITNGVITRSSNGGLGGIGLYMKGDDGNLYYYAHLERIVPGYGPGRRVQAGELIGYNGATGNARGGPPHVHMEIRPGGGANVDPYPYAAAACFSYAAR